MKRSHIIGYGTHLPLYQTVRAMLNTGMNKYLKGVELFIVGILDDLDRYDLSRFQQPRFVHITKAALANQLNGLVGALRVNALSNVIGYFKLRHRDSQWFYK